MGIFIFGIEESDFYIGDLVIFTNSWVDHIKYLYVILQKLRENGFNINPHKCEWAVEETGWLGYWLTSRGLNLWRRNINSILHMDRPRTPTELIMFIGCVNYYRDMWPSLTHLLKPLTDKPGLNKKDRLKWADKMQK